MSKTAHGFIQTARGLITDDAPPTELDGVLARAVEAVKDVEAERDAYKRALEEIVATDWRLEEDDLRDIARAVLAGQSTTTQENNT